MRNLNSYILIFALLVAFGFSSNAQENQSKAKVQENKATPTHSPKKAAIMSGILPGLGQAYNKKYWKIPLVYAALGTTAYIFWDNNTNYITFRDVYKKRIDDDPLNDTEFDYYSTEDIRQIKNIYWKNRDLTAMIFVGVWLLNVLDATVDAHLYSFDISDDLSLNIQPSLIPNQSYRTLPAYGMTFTLKIK